MTNIKLNIDYALSIDNFNHPKILKDKDCAINLVIKLMLLNPGSIESFPKMGVGLVENWRYMTEDDIPALTREIENQIATYLPHLSNVQVDLRLDSNKVLYANLVFDGAMVLISSNLETKEVKLINI